MTAIDLTLREDQVLHLVALGLTQGEIAALISTGEDNVKIHLRHVYERFGVRGGSGAARETISRAFKSRNLDLDLMGTLLDLIDRHDPLDLDMLEILNTLWAGGELTADLLGDEELTSEQGELPQPQDAGDHGDDAGADGEDVEAALDPGRCAGGVLEASDDVDDNDPQDDDGDTHHEARDGGEHDG